MPLRTLSARARALPDRLRTERPLQYAAAATLLGAVGTVVWTWPTLRTGAPMSLPAGLLLGLLCRDRREVALDRLAAWVGLLAGSPIFLGYPSLLPVVVETAGESVPFAALQLALVCIVTLISGGVMAFAGALGGRFGAWLGDGLVGGHRSGSPA